MDYSQFDVFNALEETMNFGARSLEEDNLYEAATLCTLSIPAEEDVSISTDHPAELTIHSHVTNGQLLLAINCRFSVFSNLLCSALVFTEKFESIIECFQVTEDAQTVLLCLRNGSVVAIDLKFGKYDTREILGNSDGLATKKFIEAFLEESTIDSTSFLIVNKYGVVFRIIVKRSRNEEDSIDIQSDELKNLKSDIKVAAYSIKSNTLLMSGNELISLDLEKDIELRTDPVPIKSCHVYNKHKFMVLLETGDVYLISNNLLIHRILPDRIFKQIRYFYTKNDGNFIVTLSNKTENGKSKYELIKFPDYSSLFELKISGDIYLICPHSITDDYLYISNDGNGCLRVCNIYEANPMQRLQGLLRKGKFNEADAIAAKFNLSKTEIYKARISQMMSEDILDKANMTILLDYLAKLDDDIAMKLKVCVSATEICVEFSDVARILEYGCRLEIPKKLRNSDTAALQNIIVDKRYLFETYMEIKNNVKCESYNMQRWVSFIEINLIEEVQRELNHHNFDVALLLYSRFLKKEFDLLTDKDIKKMLQSISSVPFRHSRPFFCIFIRTAVRHIPFVLPLIVSWARQRTQALESAQYTAALALRQPFPESAIDLIQAILDHVDNTSSRYVASYGWENVDMDDSHVELVFLLEMLQSIKLLRDEFDVNLPLAAFIENNQSIIHSFLMVPMDVESYKIFLREFVIPYILKTSMNPDRVFLNQIKDLLAYEEQHWISIVPAILGEFKSITLKLETILLILCRVNPPWNDIIRRLAEKTLTSVPLNHPLVAQIRRCLLDEPIQIVLSKHEYCIPKSANITDPSIFTTIVERIIYVGIVENKSAAYEEDIYTLCTTDRKMDKANLILAEHFIDHGDVDKALTYIDSISFDRKEHSCLSFLSKAMNKISAGWFTDSVKPFWFEAFEPLMNRLEHLMVPIQFKLRTSRYLNIRMLALIQTVFPESTITLRDINKPKQIENDRFLIKFLTPKFVEQAQYPKNLLELIKIAFKIAAIVVKLDGFTNKTEIDFLLSICEESYNLSVIIAIADVTCEYEVVRPSAKTLSLMAVLLMRNIGVEQQTGNTLMLEPNMLSQTMQNMSFCPMEEGSMGEDVGTNIHALQLAIRLTELSIHVHEDADTAASSNEVFVWAACMSDIVRSLDQGRSGCYGELPNINTINTLRQLTRLYCGIVGNLNNPNMNFLNNYTLNCEKYSLDESPQVLCHLEKCIQHLCIDGHYFTAWRIVNAFKKYFSKVADSITEESQQILNQLAKQVTARVLENILSQEQIDINMAYMLLTQYDYVYCAKVIGEYSRMYRKNYQKLSQIAELGLRVATFYPNQTSLRTICTVLKVRSKWILRLQPTNISPLEFFNNPADRLIVLLITAGCFSNLKLMEDFCADVGLAMEDYVEVYIQKMIINWKPERRGANVVNNGNTDELYDRVMEVAKQFNRNLFHIINNLWGSINCYYYEVFLAIIRILEVLSPDCLREKANQKTLLHFLQEYRRVGKPDKSELEEFFKRSPDANIAEPLSEWRLPFFTNTFFSTNIMKILKSEINLNTYKKWFDAIPALEGFLTKDYVCCYVIKNVVSSGTLQVDESHDWMIAVQSDIFDGISECVTHIKNLDMATSALYHLTIHTPPGADQVKAAELCYIYEKKFFESVLVTQDIEKTFEKVKVKYYSCRINQILHTYQLATETCLQLISDPNALIEMIYMDPRILRTFNSSSSSCPDINQAASEIAILYEIDIIEKQKWLIEAWLFDSGGVSSSNDTTKVLFNIGATNNEPENFNDNFKRACYIFSGENITYWQEYLVAIGMNDEADTKLILNKAWALKCLYAISSIEQLESLVDVPYGDLKNHIDKLFLVSDMNGLGYGISVETMNQMNKIRLLQKLTNHIDKNTTRIMATICTTYIILDLKCWEFILNNFIKFEQFNYLKQAAVYLTDAQPFRYKEFYINTWQCILNHEIIHLRYDTKAPIDPRFIDFVILIQTCPVLSCLKISQILEKIVQLGWWEFVAIIMQFAKFENSRAENDLIVQIKSHCPDIMNKLEEYSDQGALVIKKKCRLIRFTEIDYKSESVSTLWECIAAVYPCKFSKLVTQNKDSVPGGSTSSSIKSNPAYSISAALTYTAQLLNVIAFYLDVRIPYKMIYSDFCSKTMTDQQFTRRVARLNANLLHLCFTQNSDPMLLQPAETLHNILQLVDGSNPDLGRRGPIEVDVDLSTSLEEQLVGDLQTSEDSDSEEGDALPNEWEAVPHVQCPEAGAGPMLTQHLYLQSTTQNISSQQANSMAGGLMNSAAASIASMWRGWTGR